MKKARPKRKPTTPKTRAKRVPVDGRVKVEIGLAGEKRQAVGDVRNLNHMGMYLWSDTPLPPEAEVAFRLSFPNQKQAIDGRGWVVFCNERSMAVQFDDWDDKTTAALDGLLALNKAA